MNKEMLEALLANPPYLDNFTVADLEYVVNQYPYAELFRKCLLEKIRLTAPEQYASSLQAQSFFLSDKNSQVLGTLPHRKLSVAYVSEKPPRYIKT
jgi:hypothetical protein